MEIGSSVRPHPYHKMKLRTYIEEYLAYKGYYNAINEYGLHEVHLNVLDITRTFIDKLMAIKRHALCGTLQNKVRHIYDITKMFESKGITDFLQDKKQLKMILKLTKETDSYYLVKRDLPKEYNPLGSYDFERWIHKLDKKIKNRYETLHLDLLYTDQKQDFALAKSILKKVNTFFLAIDE